MPDDDQQKQHAQSQATERYLTQQWGVPRQQVRARLHQVANEMAQQRAAQAAAKQAETSRPAVPTPAAIQTDTRQFEPRPLTLGVDPAEQMPSDSSPTVGGQIPDIIIVYNGTAKYNILHGQTGADV